MSLLLASVALSAAAVVPACSWNEPGRHPYRGTVAEAVSRYVDIPVPTRAKLVAKLASGAADDDVVITRDAILGRDTYAPDITAMHFGRQTVCEHVTRERWAATARQPAKVYCADGECLIVPRICGNVSRVRRQVASAGGTAAPAALAGTPAAAAAPGASPAPLQASATPPHAPEVDIDATDAMAQVVNTPTTATSVPPALDAIFGEEDFASRGGRGFGLGRATPVVALTAPVVADPVPAGITALSPVPEPAGWVMFVVGVCGLLVYSRYRR